MGNRRDVDRLVGNVGVHVPAVSNVGESSTEITSRTVHSNSYNPILASSVVVSSRDKHVHRRSKKVTFVAEAIETATHEQVSPGNKEPSVTRLAAMQQAVQDQGFSEAVAVRMASSRRQGTNKLYQSRWAYWQKWCKDNGWDPNVPSSPRLTEFLLYIFNQKGWSVSTIKGYSSTICSTLRVISGKDLSSDPILKELLNSFFHERPVSRCSTPKWNLAKVLNIAFVKVHMNLYLVPVKIFNLENGVFSNFSLRQKIGGDLCLDGFSNSCTGLESSYFKTVSRLFGQNPYY